MSNSNSSPPHQKGFKITVMQGIIGTVSLVGTTAIPIVVQRALNHPAPVPAPTQSAPAQLAPVNAAPAQVSPSGASSPELTASPLLDDNREGQRKKKKND